MSMLRHTKTDFTTAPMRTRIPGLFAGTMILGAQGECPIEELRVGDRIITRDRGLATLRAISRRRVSALKAIRVRPDSLGMGRPDRPVMVAPGQTLYLRDWRAEALFGADAALVPAFRLCDGACISEIHVEDVRLFELHFEEDHVLYANGLEVGAGCTVQHLVARAA